MNVKPVPNEYDTFGLSRLLKVTTKFCGQGFIGMYLDSDSQESLNPRTYRRLKQTFSLLGQHKRYFVSVGGYSFPSNIVPEIRGR